MLWLITGGVCSGKSAFADELARSVGREGIRLSCPSFPQWNTLDQQEDKDGREHFPWVFMDADDTLANKLNAINLESNIFRADRRVIVLDSLSGWLRCMYHRAESDNPDEEARIDAAWQEVIASITSFQGKMIVVTEDITAGLSMSLQEQGYAFRLASANRKLLDISTTLYRMTAGMATEVKGYRLKRGKVTDENIYSDR